MLVLITYDVNTEDAAGRRRLRQIAKQCVNYGQRVQNSVFECLLDAAQCRMLQAKLLEIMDERRDSLRFYYLGNRTRTRSSTLAASRRTCRKIPSSCNGAQGAAYLARQAQQVPRSLVLSGCTRGAAADRNRLACPDGRYFCRSYERRAVEGKTTGLRMAARENCGIYERRAAEGKLREKLPLKRAVPKRTSATRFAHSTRAASHRARSGAHARAFSWRSNRTVRGCAPCHSAVYRHMHDAFFHDRRIFRRLPFRSL